MSSVRTVFIFRDLPVHMEFRAGQLPILPLGTVLEFDLVLKDPKDKRRSRHITGPYGVASRKLAYSATRPEVSGITQYLEFEPHVSPAGKTAR